MKDSPSSARGGGGRRGVVLFQSVFFCYSMARKWSELANCELEPVAARSAAAARPRRPTRAAAPPACRRAGPYIVPLRVFLIVYVTAAFFFIICKVKLFTSNFTLKSSHVHVKNRTYFNESEILFLIYTRDSASAPKRRL